MTDTQDNEEANVFAMNLLVPGSMLRHEIRKLGGIDLCDDEAARKLAKLFGVSLTVMALRIGEEFCTKHEMP